MRFLIILGIFSLGFPQYISAGKQPSVIPHVYGNEHNRKPLPFDQNDPVSKIIGGIAKRAKIQCTGFLVGPAWVLTAKHCIDEPIEEWKFFYKAIDGTTTLVFPVESILAMGHNYAKFGPQDWVLLQLVEKYKPRDDFGWFRMGTKQDLEIINGKNLSVAGYGMGFSQNEELTAHEGCSRRDGVLVPEDKTEEDKRLFRSIDVNPDIAIDCSVSKGDSGGPVWLSKTRRDRHPVAVALMNYMTGYGATEKEQEQVREYGHLKLKKFSPEYANQAVALSYIRESIVKNEILRKELERIEKLALQKEQPAPKDYFPFSKPLRTEKSPAKAQKQLQESFEQKR